MIKNASSVHKTPLETILGPNVDRNALDLVSQLLLFNPHDRLTAKQALEHPYIAKFHDPSEEISMKSNAIIPFDDDVRLSVEDYRNKLYEIMSSPRHRSVKVSHLTPGLRNDVNYRLAKSTERYLKGHLYKQSYASQSEPKMSNFPKPPNVANIKSDSKVLTKCNIRFPRELCKLQAGGDCNRVKLKSRSELMGKNCKKMDSSKCLYNGGFNSYNRNHGIISQSALTELKAAGLR